MIEFHVLTFYLVSMLLRSLKLRHTFVWIKDFQFFPLLVDLSSGIRSH